MAFTLNLCCGVNMVSLFNKESLKSGNLSILFITHFVAPFAFLTFAFHSLNKNKFLVIKQQILSYFFIFSFT